MASVSERQAELHRQERAKYHLIHPELGTITKERADQIWSERGMENSIGDVVTADEDKIIRFLWDQLSGGSSFMSAFFIFLNQEPSKRQYEYPHTAREVNSNRWVEVTGSHYFDMLCSLPPEAQDGYAFAMGEPLCTMNDGRIVFDCFTKVANRYFEKPYPLDCFDHKAFEQQIREQFKF